MYRLTLTEPEIKRIHRAGDYDWSRALTGLEIGENYFTDQEAWDLRECLIADPIFDNDLFHGLEPESKLYRKLLVFCVTLV